MKKVAIIGSGISGLGSAWFLQHDFDVTIFEAADYAGGHTCTVNVDEAGGSVPIDTGFMVFNHVTYPNLTRLFQTLGVPTKPTGMSFGVQHRPTGLEYCGSSFNHLFAQRRNLMRPSYWSLLRQIGRFNREAVVQLDDPATIRMTLEEYVECGDYGDAFLQLYLIPMTSAVWSTPPEKMRRFPAATLLRFLHNHGMLGMSTHHQWWTVDGGSRCYVDRLTAALRGRLLLRTPVRRVRRRDGGGVEVATDSEVLPFDKVILACHAPTALALLGAGASPAEKTLLAPFRYQPNTVTLHTDERVMPRTRLAWSAWNYRLDSAEPPGAQPAAPSDSVPAASAPLRVSTHYWMNRLQGVSERVNYFVSVEGSPLLAPERIRRTFAYEHPLFDLAAVQAQTELAGLNAAAHRGTETYFVGAWQRYGFHEDGLLSALNVARLLLARDPWSVATDTVRLR